MHSPGAPFEVLPHPSLFACVLKMLMSCVMGSVVMLGGGMTPASAVMRSSDARMRASAGVKDGIVRYLCLKNTELHICV